MVKKIHIYCTGLCAPENGGIGVAGFVAFDGGGELRAESEVVGTGTGMTDVIAEYMSVVRALEWACANYPRTELNLRLDSHRLFKQLSGGWGVRDPRLQKFWNHIKSAEAEFVGVEYELVEHDDPHLTKLKSSVRSVYLSFVERADMAAKELSRTEELISFGRVDEARVRTLADSMYQFMQVYASPQEAYLAIKVIQGFFERAIGYRFETIADAEHVWRLARDLLTRKIGEGLELQKQLQKPESKPREGGESDSMYA